MHRLPGDANGGDRSPADVGFNRDLAWTSHFVSLLDLPAVPPVIERFLQVDLARQRRRRRSSRRILRYSLSRRIKTCPEGCVGTCSSMCVDISAERARL